jgi:hypothetical protein
MEVILICIIIALALFVSAFITKRRFGLLGLALATGSILSGIWGYNAGLVASCFGIPSGPITSAVVLALIILLPAGILLFHGYTYRTLVGQIVGASLFTLLALAFLVEPLSNVLILHGYSANVYDWLSNNRTTIIGFGLIIAIVDLFLTKPVRLSDKRRMR